MHPPTSRLGVYKELVQTEERFTDIKDALKPLNKMDFDKLISAVRCRILVLSESC